LSARTSARRQASRKDSRASRSLTYTSRRPTRTAIWPHLAGADKRRRRTLGDILHPRHHRLSGYTKLVVADSCKVVGDGRKAAPLGGHELGPEAISLTVVITDMKVSSLDMTKSGIAGACRTVRTSVASDVLQLGPKALDRGCSS
jgi:hypothetical protein